MSFGPGKAILAAGFAVVLLQCAASADDSSAASPAESPAKSAEPSKTVLPVTPSDQAAVQEGYDAASKMVFTPAKEGEQEFEFKGHKFSVAPGKNIRMQALEHGEGKSFVFLGAQRADKSSPAFSVLVLASEQLNAPEAKAAVLAGMLQPYQQRMSEYAEDTFNLTLSGERKETGVKYSGLLGGKVKTCGFFVVVPVKNACYVISGLDRFENKEESDKLFADLAKSLKIES